jgi:hypothetical protein
MTASASAILPNRSQLMQIQHSSLNEIGIGSPGGAKKGNTRKSLDTLSAIKDSPDHENISLSKIDGKEYRSFLVNTQNPLNVQPRKSLLA